MNSSKKKYNRGYLTRRNSMEVNGDVELYVIGDIHGCFDEFVKLLDKIEEDFAKNSSKKFIKIILLGDILDRGPKPFHCLWEILDRGLISLMGNHESSFLNEHYGLKECRSSARRITLDEFAKLDEYDKMKFLAMIKNFPYFMYVKTPNRNFFLSHAPYKFAYDFDGTIDHVVKNANYFSLASNNDPLDYDRLSLIEADLTFVHGHQSWNYTDVNEQALLQKENRVKSFNLDASCVYGGELVALRLLDNVKVSVKSNFDCGEKRSK